jgi:hypothetical protein
LDIGRGEEWRSAGGEENLFIGKGVAAGRRVNGDLPGGRGMSLPRFKKQGWLGCGGKKRTAFHGKSCITFVSKRYFLPP